MDFCTDILYYCKQLVQKNCTSVYITHINGTHPQTRTLYFIYVDSCTEILYYCTHCTTEQMECTSVYTTVLSAQHDTTYTHLWCPHYAWISCTPVRLYCSPVTVHLYCRTWRILTNEIPSKITFMNCVDQSELRFSGVLTPPQPP